MSAKKKPNKVPAPAKPEGEYQEALTEAELQEVKKQARPGIAKMLGTSFALAVIGGGALAGGLALGTDAPQRADFEISQTADMEITNSFTTEVHNPEGVLTAEDEARMQQDVERLEVPAVVEQLHYIVFEENDDNVNDTVEE